MLKAAIWSIHQKYSVYFLDNLSNGKWFMKLSGEVLNVQLALTRLDGDRELYNELLALYLRELPKLRESLKIALLSGDLSQIAVAAHTLKGASDNLGADRMVMFCRGVESLCRGANSEMQPGALIEQLMELSLEIEQKQLS